MPHQRVELGCPERIAHLLERFGKQCVKSCVQIGYACRNCQPFKRCKNNDCQQAWQHGAESRRYGRIGFFGIKGNIEPGNAPQKIKQSGRDESDHDGDEQAVYAQPEKRQSFPVHHRLHHCDKRRQGNHGDDDRVDGSRPFDSVVIFGQAMADGDSHDHRQQIESAVLHIDAEHAPIRAENSGHECVVTFQGKVGDQHCERSCHDQRQGKSQPVPYRFKVRVVEKLFEIGKRRQIGAGSFSHETFLIADACGNLTGISTKCSFRIELDPNSALRRCNPGDYNKLTTIKSAPALADAVRASQPCLAGFPAF